MSETCPGCGLADQVQHVPAAYHAGHAFYRGQGPMVAMPVGDSVIFSPAQVSGISVTATARALDPFPVRRRIAGFVGGAVALGFAGALFCLYPASVLADMPTGLSGVAALAIASIPATAVFVCVGVLVWLALRRVRQNRRTSKGIPAAQALWARGRYCHRCGGVFFPAEGRLLAPARFRELVAAAGGY